MYRIIIVITLSIIMKRKYGEGKEIRICEVCGSSFESLICNKRRFCSLACGYKGRHVHKNQKEYKCLVCGKSVVRCSSWVVGNVFCSRKCSALYQTDKPGTGGRDRDPNKRKWLTCKQCGKIFERFVCSICSEDVFCSQSCSAKYTNKYKRGSKSKLEKWLGIKLKELKLPVLLNNREILNGYELDIYFPTKSLAFEIDGPWHRLPFNGIEHFEKIKHNDELKNKLCTELNIKLIRISNEAQFTEKIGEPILSNILQTYNTMQ